MNKFEALTAIAAPFPKKNVDTDLIIRIERCTGMPKEGAITQRTPMLASAQTATSRELPVPKNSPQTSICAPR